MPKYCLIYWPEEELYSVTESHKVGDVVGDECIVSDGRGRNYRILKGIGKQGNKFT